MIFIGDLTNRDAFRPRATGFLVGVPSSRQGLWFSYLVTAEHVVVGLAAKQRQIYCRLNRRDGSAKEEPLQVPRWWHHPHAEIEQTDVAVAAVHMNWDVVGHDCIPMPETWGPDPIRIGRQHIGLGDETFTIGLFRRHAGTERNIPIVRVSNVAALPEEPIPTKWGLMSGYLVEMRSIAGLSGSPVFAHMPSGELTMGNFVMPDPRFRPDYEQVNWSQYRFLGLIHGHFDIPDLQEDSVIEDEGSTEAQGVNTGIGIVIPANKITETLYQPDLISERQQLEAIWDKENAATPDSG